MNGKGFAPLTRATRQSVIERVERDPAFTVALHDEAATLLLSGEPEIARSILHDLVNATITIDERSGARKSGTVKVDDNCIARLAALRGSIGCHR